MESCVLFQNEDHTITLFDIPRSIELAQGSEELQKRLISTEALQEPYPSIEPKSAKALANLQTIPVRDLLLQRYLEIAVEETKQNHKGPWCLPRATQSVGIARFSSNGKRKEFDSDEDISNPLDFTRGKKNLESGTHGGGRLTFQDRAADSIQHNPETITKLLQLGSPPILTHIPPQSTWVLGDIEQTCTIFDRAAPKFNLIVIDPPWPNRSARRKQSYALSYGTPDITALLLLIPLAKHLAEDALVGIWVTNKPAFYDLILGPNGLFEQWGLEMVEEWIWLKVTASGQPICALDSAWRKPYEMLLVGKSKGSSFNNTSNRTNIKRRIIIGVPDLHSRKPNLQTLFKPMLPVNYEALEIFARNITVGWWAWGNEVLKFQRVEHWQNNPG